MHKDVEDAIPIPDLNVQVSSIVGNIAAAVTDGNQDNVIRHSDELRALRRQVLAPHKEVE